MKRKGSSLIELMVYLALASFLMYHCIPWSITILLRYNTLHNHAKNIVDCCISHDLFMKDIFEGSHKKEEWLFQDDEHIVWKQNNQTYVGWACEDNSLFRITGFFDVMHNRWNKKHTIPLLHNVHHLSFKIVSQELGGYMVTLSFTLYGIRYAFSGVPRYADY